MNLLLTIKSLYAVNGIVAVLLYLPQICKAWKDRDHALSLSLISFGGWSMGSLVSALYAWLFVKDKMFTVVSIGNMAGSGAVFLIVLFSRLDIRRRWVGWVGEKVFLLARSALSRESSADRA
jgi:uncharacterized protein with PQ loop repeat